MGRGSEQSGVAATALLYGKVTPRRKRPSLDRELAETLAQVWRLFAADPVKYQHAEDRELGRGLEACAITALGFARDCHRGSDMMERTKLARGAAERFLERTRLARGAAERFERMAEAGLLEVVEENVFRQARSYRLTESGLAHGLRLSSK